MMELDGGSMSGGESAARRSLSPHLRCLRWCGFCALGRSAAPPAAAAHQLYRLLALLATTAYLLQECVYAYQERANLDKLAGVMFLLLCHVTSIVKQLVFHTDAAHVDRLVYAFDEPVFNEAGAVAGALLAECAGRARGLLAAFAGAAVVTCTLWLIFPVAQFARGEHVEFAFWSGVDTRRPLGFAAMLLYSYYVTTLVGIANTTMDAFMATVLYQCKTQLTILRINFESLLDRAKKEKQDSEDYETTVMRMLVQCITHHKKICEQCEGLQAVFGAAILVQFAIGGWILCMAAYQLVSLRVLSVEFASMALFICCILTELFLYCYFGNEVAVESWRLVESVYACGWERGCGARGGRVRPALVLCLLRAGRPLRVAAGRVVPLSLDTFIKILKSSYTFYAVLRQTK